MKCHRLHEVLELLQPYWSKDPDLHLLQILQKIANEAGFDKPISELTDEVIIYHLKMHGTDKHEPIPELKKIMKRISKLHCLKHVVFLNKGRIYEKTITDIILAFCRHR